GCPASRRRLLMPWPVLGGPGNERAGGDLVAAILISKRFQASRFRSGNSCRFGHRMKNEQRTIKCDPAPRRTEREQEISDPNDPVSEVVRVARILPEPGRAYFFGIAPVGSKSSKLEF